MKAEKTTSAKALNVMNWYEQMKLFYTENFLGLLSVLRESAPVNLLLISSMVPGRSGMMLYSSASISSHFLPTPAP